MSEGRRDVVLLHQQFGPYHVARALALEERMPGRVHFVQLASREAEHPWQVAGAAPAIRTVMEGPFQSLSPSALAARLNQVLDELIPRVVIIAGYAHRAMRQAAVWCRRRGATSILLSDSHRVDRRRWRWKEWGKRWWIGQHFDAAFTAGSLSTAYLRDLGFASSKIWRGYDVVDNAFFEKAAEAGRARGRDVLRQHGLPDQIFLYVGRFNPHKNVLRLLDALEEYRTLAGGKAWGLLLVGSGPLRDALERRAAAMKPGVAVTEFKQAGELAEIYGAASAFILPSLSEPWGLVVNEAMASGLPVLGSDRAGATLDLVFPGINGCIFDPEDTSQMAQAMLHISSERVDRVAMGQASRRIISTYTPASWAAALADCIEVSALRRKAQN